MMSAPRLSRRHPCIAKSYSMTVKMAWRTRPLQSVLSGGPVTPTPIRGYNGLGGENRGPFKGQQASASNPVMVWINQFCVRYDWSVSPLCLIIRSQSFEPVRLGDKMFILLWNLVKGSAEIPNFNVIVTLNTNLTPLVLWDIISNSFSYHYLSKSLTYQKNNHM